MNMDKSLMWIQQKKDYGFLTVHLIVDILGDHIVDSRKT